MWQAAPKQWDALNDKYMMGKSTTRMKGWEQEEAEAAEDGDDDLDEEEEEGEEEGE